jgi:hypothetical protein
LKETWTQDEQKIMEKMLMSIEEEEMTGTKKVEGPKDEKMLKKQ